MSLLTDIARAKVNLTLRVHGRRADGYHELESLVAFADCADTLALEPASGLKLTATGPGAPECGDGDDNLVIRAARALGERIAGLKAGHFTLEKHLPVAAGIGGGSADAAAALRLLARANGIDPRDPRVVEVARATGADIPVCLQSRACTMSGVGENLSFLNLPALPCVMVNPRIAVATKDVFAALGLAKGEAFGSGRQSPSWPSGTATVEQWCEAIAAGTNDLEPPALKVEPAIGVVLAALRASAGIRFARISGSGATCFGIFRNAGDAEQAAKAISRQHSGWWVHVGTLS
ncbi:MAG: 4-(cytidine 5'-diphospho)-2-C-methyl-D-erythritol kinase [Rhizobiales bacterium]|nr:4-(cytidine 5'-diphospho)-2-C-methyl-D-erythritol kinase [Hyphomicrobiales bacterium]